jgi:hypothetical protein
VKFTDRNLNPDAGQKTDQDGTRQKIGKEAQAKDSGEKKDRGGHQRYKAGKFDVPWRVFSKLP